MNTLPINNLAKKHLRCLATILVVLFLSSFYAAHAQESLPVKDYSVGNQFVYSVGSGSAVENVVADTLINGVRYGIVESSYNNSYYNTISKYFMRSTESAIYQYDTATKRESLVYSYGDGCISSLGMSWINGGLVSVCGFDAALSSPMIIYYGNPSFQASTNSGGYARYLKPYGIIAYGNQYCHLEYSQGHTTRPVEYSGAGWYTVCYPSSAQLISGIVRGKSINLNGEPDSFFLRWTASNSIVGFRQTQRLSLKLTNALYGVPANRFGKTSARCSFTVDTSLVDIVGMKTAKGNQPDSIKYINGKALLYCSFSIAPESTDIGYIDITSKATKDTTLSLAVENYAIIPTPMYAMTSTLNLSLQKLKMNFYVSNFTPSVSVGFSKRFTISFGMQSIFTPSVMPPPSYTLSLDTTGLDSIEIVAANSEAPLVPDKVTYSGGKTEYLFLRPAVQSYPFAAGRLRFRSKSLQARENAISIFTNNTATGIEYIPASITLKQTGVAAFGFQPDFVSQLEQGKNLVKHLAPNPATDVLTIRYAMGNSAENVQLELVSTLGTVQKSVTLSKYDYGVHDIVMDVSDIAPGIYLLRVRSNGNVETQKVLIGR